MNALETIALHDVQSYPDSRNLEIEAGGVRGAAGAHGRAASRLAHRNGAMTCVIQFMTRNRTPTEKDRIMKRLIAAVSFAVFAAPAAAAGLPYHQNVIDRMLPNIEERAASSGKTGKATPAAELPYEQHAIDRMLPNIQGRVASTGETRGSALDARGSPWAKDHKFIAPAL